MSDGAERVRQKEELKKLVKKYRELFDKKRPYGLKKISEADVRQKFIDPLFKILGWDTENLDEYNLEMYVRPGFADITLMLDGKPAAFVEAKRFQIIPWVDRKTIDWIEEERQVMNYAASIEPPVKWAILTNFERLRVFNALNGNLIMAFEDVGEYEKRFDELLYLSKESFESGRIEALEKHEERPDIDLRFLEMLNRWRLELARDIYERNRNNPALQENGKISMNLVKEAIQRLIDRLIIVRYAEDRFILENPDILKTIMRSWETAKEYIRLMTHISDYFRGFDKIHDSSIFEEGHVLDKTDIGSEVLASVINDLYTVNFRKFDFDILGNTYETYLGETLAIDEKENIILKPVQQTRKKSGIYYTPAYVVDYIVKNTLGEALKGKTPEEVKKLRVLDPSCGSGSFLIKAYDYFVNFYEEENQRIEEKKREILANLKKNGNSNGMDAYDALAGIKSYSGYEKEILKNNIYGVDLDEHAAEIAAVNLMLKALKQREKLPLILGDHIKVGNSLISGDEETLTKYFGDNRKEKRAFNWEEEFREAFEGENPGFDVIIGNPPYIRNTELPIKDKVFFKENYISAYKQYDILVLFFEKGIKLLKEGGFLSFITSNKFMASDYGEKLREFILKNCRIVSLIDVSNLKIFRDASTYPVITILQKEKKKNRDNQIYFKKVDEINELTSQKNIIKIKQSALMDSESNKFIEDVGNTKYEIIKKISKNSVKIKELFTCQRGSPKNKINIFNEKVKDSLQSIVSKDVDRYSYEVSKYFVVSNLQNKILNEKKILMPHTVLRLKAALDSGGEFIMDRIYFLIAKERTKVDMKLVTAILNSKLIDFYYKTNFGSTHVGGGYLDLRGSQISEIPIKISPENQKQEIIKLVDKMLSLNKQLAAIDINFEDYVNRHGRIKDEKLENYLSRSGIKPLKDGKGVPASTIEHDKKDLKVKAVLVDESGDNLIFSAKIEENGKTRLINIFSVPVEDVALRKFIYHSVRTFVKASAVGKGNLYEKILKLKIPRFKESAKDNGRIIHEIMAEYLPRLEEWSRIKGEIEETDKEIDSRVYALYGLTDEEIRIIEDTFGDD